MSNIIYPPEGIHEFIQLIRNGSDQELFNCAAWLINHYSTAIKNWVFKKFGASIALQKLAMDAMTDAIAALFLKIRNEEFSIQSGEGLFAWLFVVAKRVFLKNYNKEKRHRKFILIPNPEPVEITFNKTLKTETLSPEVPENEESVRSAITLLNPVCQNYLLQHYLQGKSIAEIQQETGLNYYSITTQMYKCRKKLKEILINKFGFPKKGLWN